MLNRSTDKPVLKNVGLSNALSGNKQDVIKKNYGTWTVKDLTAELRTRGAKISGNKKALVQRLEDLDRILIYKDQCPPSVKDHPYTFTPPDLKLYQDVSSKTVLSLYPSFYKDYFQSIDIQISQERGKNMYQEKYLLSLRAANLTNVTYIRGRVAAQMKKQVIYNVDIKLQNQFITEVNCECAAGIGPSAYCKHVTVVFCALVNFLNDKTYLSRETCTSQLQTFHQPSRSKKLLHSPVKVKSLNLPKPKLLRRVIGDEKFDPRPPNRRKQPEYYDYFRNKCIAYAANSNTQFPELQLFKSANIHAINVDHDYCQVSLAEAFLENMFITKISLEQRDEIEFKTRGQNKNKYWFQERYLRLNSSTFFDICTEQDQGKVLAMLLKNTDISHLPAVQHGLKYEIHAVRKFEILTTIQTLECGLFVSLEHPFLAASPDRIISDTWIIEVKCPFSAANKIISPKTVPYIYQDPVDNQIKLDKDHRYYYQIQGQLLCTNRLACLLVIYTIADCFIIKVDRDEQFIDIMKNKLIEFFNSYFKAALLDKYFFRCN